MILFRLSRKTVTWLFVGALTLALFSALASTYRHSAKVTENIAEAVLSGISSIVAERTGNILHTTEAQLRTDAVMAKPVSASALPDTQTYWLPLFREQLKLNTSINSIYIADTAGNLIQFDRVPNIRSLTIDRRGQTPRKQSVIFAQDNTELSRFDETTTYDPRTRPWYKAAMQGAADTVYWSSIYTFDNTGDAGITASIPFFDNAGKLAGVIGADLRLQQLADFLEQQAFTDQDLAVIVDEQQELIAYPPRLTLEKTTQTNTRPTLQMVGSSQQWLTKGYEFWQKNQDLLQTGTQSGATFWYSADDQNYGMAVLNFPLAKFNWKILVAAPEDDLLNGASQSIAQGITLSLLALLLFGFILYVVFGKPFRMEVKS